eukprot:gene57235-76428_t
MGGIISSSMTWEDKKSNVNEFRHLTLREGRSVQAVDMFLQLTLSQLHREECIKSVVENPIALDTLVQYLLLKLQENNNSILESLKGDLYGSNAQ